ncbi:MAG: 50S ribosomal protein L25 [Candidatus Methylacidiphilales bacterium]
MSQRIQLTATRRQRTGRGGSIKVRSEGHVPAVLYGAGEPQSLQVSAVSFIEALQSVESENVLVNLHIEGEGASAKTHLALIQEVQHHPIKDTVLHIDFHEVRQDQKIQAHVPIHEEGVADGVKNSGGILDHLIRSLHIECLPNDLPSHVTVDVSGLKLGESILVKDLQLPSGVSAVQDADLPVFMVHAPRVQADDAAAADAVKEPEVITKKKTEEE